MDGCWTVWAGTSMVGGLPLVERRGGDSGSGEITHLSQRSLPPDEEAWSMTGHVRCGRQIPVASFPGSGSEVPAKLSLALFCLVPVPCISP